MGINREKDTEAAEQRTQCIRDKNRKSVPGSQTYEIQLLNLPKTLYSLFYLNLFTLIAATNKGPN